MRIFRLLVLVLALALAAAACGDDGAGTTTTESDTVPRPSSTIPVDTAPATTLPPATTTVSPTTTTEAPATTVPPTTTTVPSTTTTVDDGVFEIRVVVSAGNVVVDIEPEVELDTMVRILIVADVSDEVHVHGYDHTVDVAAGESALLEFLADIPGIFEVEFEDARLELFELVVGA